MPASNQKSRFRDTTSLAGWLFADLFLGLIIVFMASSQLPVLSDQIATPTSPSINITQTSAVIPTSTAIIPTSTKEIGIDTTPLIFFVEVGNMSEFLYGYGEDNDVKQDFILQVGKKLENYKNRRVGLIITQGYHTKITTGLYLAEVASKLIISNNPDIFHPENLIEKSYWYGADKIHPSGTIKFEIYFFTQ